MSGKETIRKALADLDIYPIGEVNACQIYKNWAGWHIQRFGEQPWVAGQSVQEVLDALKEIVESRKG